MRTIYTPRIQPEFVERALFALHAAASLFALSLFVVAVAAWSIGFGA
jgi:hypothetical protein